MVTDKRAVADQLSELQEGSSEPPRRDVSLHPNEGSARMVVGTLLFYVALPVFLLGVFAPLYSTFYWLRTGAWKNVTLVDLTPPLAGWHPSWVMFDYVLTQAHVALPAIVLAVILFFVCAFLFAD